MSVNGAIGQRIRAARLAQQLSQADVGRLLTRQRSYAAVSDIERGKTHITCADLIELARILDAGVLELLTGSPVEQPTQPLYVASFRERLRRAAS